MTMLKNFNRMNSSYGVGHIVTVLRGSSLSHRRKQAANPPGCTPTLDLNDDNEPASCAVLWGAIAVQEVSEDTVHRRLHLVLVVSFVDTQQVYALQVAVLLQAAEQAGSPLP